MTLVISRLNSTLFNQSLRIDHFNSLSSSFSECIKTLGPEFYREIIPSHLVLNLEYRLLGQKIRSALLSEQPIKKERMRDQLLSALLLAELLEHVYEHYLTVPREVVRLRAQQKIYREVFNKINPIVPQNLEYEKVMPLDVSFSQYVREETAHINFYRLLFLRSKRVFDLIAFLNLGSNWYRYLICTLDKYTDPVLPHIAWVFFLPRLLVNLFLFLKHIIPTPWMDEKEKSLGEFIRFQAQLLRRWFELGNDLTMFTVGLINGFVLTGILAPVALYLSIATFGFDVFMSAGRTYIELNRLYELYKEYQNMPIDAEHKEELTQQLKLIQSEINFEMLRFGSHTLTTTGIFLAMCCMAPILGLNPAILLVSSIFLVCISLINFILAPIINHFRPKDIIDIPSGGVRSLSFFAKKPEIEPQKALCTDNFFPKTDVFSPAS